jgi:chromatin remodeling complex protein RSC6
MSTTEAVKKSSKKASTKSTKRVETEQPAEPLKVEAVKVESSEKKQKKEKKEKKLPSAKELPVAEPAPAESAPAESEERPAGEEEKLSRKKKNYNQLVSEVDGLNKLVDRYVTDHKDQKVPGMNKFLKDLEKGLKKVRIQVQKIGKTKASGTSSSNTQSGFQKPVRISDEVARFTGWDAAEPRARVEVTNFVCDYIKRNNLQSSSDRRVINADSNLSQLLDYQSERDGNLTYATIQKLLAKHYTPVAASS